MTDDLTSLASAYLDGELDADARAEVDANAEILAEVDRLRQVRAVLAELPAPSISARERHLSAALDAWDRLPDAERTGSLRDVTPTGADAAAAAGVAAMTAPARSGSRRARRRGFSSNTWLGAAAAGLVVVLAGGLMLRSLSGSDDDGDVSSAAVSDATASEEAPAPAVASAADAVEQPELESAATVRAELALDTEAGSDAAPPPEDDLPVLGGPDDLAAFAAIALEAPASGDLPAGATVSTDPPSDDADEATTEGSTASAEFEMRKCLSVDVIVGLAIYDDQEVVVGIDESRDLAIAYVAEGCIRIASAPLP